MQLPAWGVELEGLRMQGPTPQYFFKMACRIMDKDLFRIPFLFPAIFQESPGPFFKKNYRILPMWGVGIPAETFSFFR